MTTGPSNLTQTLSLRTAVQRLQRELQNVRTEAATGKVADRGLALGVRSNVSVDLQEQVKRINTIRSMNGGVTSRLEATQTALDSMRGVLSAAMGQFTLARTAGGEMGIAQSAARDALSQINDLLNATFSGQYLFSGVNTDVKPVSSSPNDPASPGRAAINASFAAQFGMTQSDPALVNVTPEDMTSYLSGAFAGLFSDSGWRGTFSGASDRVIQSRISISEVAPTSASTDAQPFRDITRALSMVAQIGIDKMNPRTATVALDAAIQALSAGQEGVAAMQATLGRAQQRVNEASDRLQIQSQSLAKSIGDLEDVDPYQVSVRLNNLSTQLETSYALTSRMQNLSLLKYL